MEHGLRIRDGDDVLLLTPDISSIVSAGRASMPVGLNDDDTYGIDIDLPGDEPWPEESIGVLAHSFRVNIDLLLYNLNNGGLFCQSWFMNDDFTFYTRNESTGVMTVWTPDKSSPINYDACLAAYPIAFWDKLGKTSFTSIRIFAATAYFLKDTSDIGADINYSLTGIATGSGYNRGVPANVKDNDTETYCGYYIYVSGEWNTGSYSFSITVTLAQTQTITKVEVYHTLRAWRSHSEYPYQYAHGYWYIDLYYGDDWHQVANGSFINNVNVTQTDSEEGNWVGVSAIRIRGTGSIDVGPGDFCYLWHYVRELRAWGPPVGELSDKLVYSIGTQGIEKVDYAVALRYYKE